MPPRVIRKKFGFFGKLWLLLMLAVIGGCAWAMAETGTKPGDLVKLFSPAPAPPPVARDFTPKTKSSPPMSRDPLQPGIDPATGTPTTTARDPVVPAKPYSTDHMKGIFGTVDNLLRLGQIKEARENLNRVTRLLVPAEMAPLFRQYESDLHNYYQLLLDTVPRATIELPTLAELELKNGNSMLVKNLKDADTHYRFETLIGIRGSMPKDSVTRTKPLDREHAAAYIDIELEKQAGYLNIKISTMTPEGTSQWRAEDVQGRPAPQGLAFFKLADFCARNGRNIRLVPLFSEGLKRDPHLPRTVYEDKSAQLVEVFMYFLTLRSKEDCRQAFNLLKSRYRDSVAFRDKVEGDRDIMDAYESLFGEAMAIAPPKKPDEEKGTPPDPTILDTPKPSATPTPTETAKPSNEPSPTPKASPTAAPVPSPTPTPSTPPKDEGIGGDFEKQEGSRKTKLPEETPKRIADMVARGDDMYETAMKHVLNSDQNTNPSGWQAENKKALDLLTKAFNDCYYKAQEEYEKLKKAIPRTLLDRARECQVTRVMCRKRSISK